MLRSLLSSAIFLANGLVFSADIPKNLLPEFTQDSGLEAVFKRDQGDYYALCSNSTWKVATILEIQSGELCNLLTPYELPLGSWDFTVDWECNGQTYPSSITFYENYRFANLSFQGSWELEGDMLTFTYDRGTQYTGRFDGVSKVVGTMTSFNGDKGCFEINFPKEGYFTTEKHAPNTNEQDALTPEHK